MDNLKIGHWAFIIGLLITVLSPFINIPFTATLLFILGLVVGFLNINERETNNFLLAVVALVLIGVGGIQLIALTDPLVLIFQNLIAIASAAALVVSVKTVLTVGRAG